MNSNVVVQTLETSFGRVTIIVEDSSYWRAQALGDVIIEKMREVLKAMRYERSECPEGPAPVQS